MKANIRETAHQKLPRICKKAKNLNESKTIKIVEKVFLENEIRLSKTRIFNWSQAFDAICLHRLHGKMELLESILQKTYLNFFLTSTCKVSKFRTQN